MLCRSCHPISMRFRFFGRRCVLLRRHVWLSLSDQAEQTTAKRPSWLVAPGDVPPVDWEGQDTSIPALSVSIAQAGYGAV